MSKEKRFSILKYLIVLAVLVAVLVLWVRKHNEKRSETEAIRLPVQTVQAEFGRLEKSIRTTAYIESDNMVTVLPLVSGRIKVLHANVSDTLRKGDLIAEIDPESFELQYRQAKAAFEAAESTWERTQRMYNNKAVSRQEYEQARARYTNYKNQMDMAKLQLNYASVTTPVSGTVLVKHIREGQLAAPQIPIMTIGDLDSLTVTAAVPEQYYSRFVQDDGIRAELHRPDDSQKKHAAFIRSVAPYISPESRKFDVLCDVRDEQHELRPGMFVVMEFVLSAADSLWYCPSEVRQSGSIWIVDSGDVAREIILPTPEFDNGYYFSIPEKWKDSRFIIEGQYFLEGRPKVKIMGSE